jgi:hypothetical protein
VRRWLWARGTTEVLRREEGGDGELDLGLTRRREAVWSVLNGEGWQRLKLVGERGAGDSDNKRGSGELRRWSEVSPEHPFIGAEGRGGGRSGGQQ